MSSILTYKPEIDGLRAISVLLVVFFHAYPTAVPGGFVGVDIFFVISGYLITGIIFKSYKAGSFSFFDFYLKRILRIFPALSVVLIIVLCLGIYTLTPKELVDLSRHVMAGAGFSSNLLLWKEVGYFDTASELKPLLHLWSLGVEEQFYIIWPLLIVIAIKHTKTALLLLITFGASFILNVVSINNNAASVFYLPQTRFWELLIGAGLVYLQTRHTDQSRPFLYLHAVLLRLRETRWVAWGSEIQSGLGIAFLIIAVVSLDKHKNFPGWWALLPTMAGCLIISAGNGSWFNRKILSSAPLVLIGKISFPLYLFHWPLLVFPRILSSHEHVYATIGALSISFMLAYFTYRFIEVPLRKDTLHKKRNALLLTVCLLGIGLLSLFIYSQQGFPARFKNLEIFNEKLTTNWRQTDCFIDAMESEVHAKKCIDPPRTASDNLVVLWGDSFAAHLYPGFLELQDSNKNLRLAQFSESSCPPVLGYEISVRPLCKRINDRVIEQIIHLKPAVVVLAADWATAEYPKSQIFLDGIIATVSRLKAAKVPKIILVGTLPRWQQPLPRVLLNATQANWRREVPKRLLPLDTSKTDAFLAQAVKQLEIEYFRPKDVLCTLDGCLTIVESPKDGQNHITSFDTVHLTDYGSSYVVTRLVESLELLKKTN